MALPRTAIEPLSFREALGHYASGITVITSHVDDEPIGFTCQSFYSVSMSPPTWRGPMCCWKCAAVAPRKSNGR